METLQRNLTNLSDNELIANIENAIANIEPFDWVDCGGMDDCEYFVITPMGEYAINYNEFHNSYALYFNNNIISDYLDDIDELRNFAYNDYIHRIRRILGLDR